MSDFTIKQVLPKNLTEQERGEVISTFARIAASVGQDPGEHIKSWLQTTDVFLVAHHPGGVAGFAGYSFLGKDFIYLPVAMVDAAHQGKGLAGKFVRTIIKRFIVKRLKESWFAPWRIFNPIYVLFRTQNPTAYAGFYKSADVFPCPEGDFVPPRTITDKVQKYARQLWQDAHFERSSYILKGAYKQHPTLAVNPDEIMWSENEKIDNFFKDTLNIEHHSLDALVVLVRITPRHLLRMM